MNAGSCRASSPILIHGNAAALLDLRLTAQHSSLCLGVAGLLQISLGLLLGHFPHFFLVSGIAPRPGVRLLLILIVLLTLLRILVILVLVGVFVFALLRVARL